MTEATKNLEEIGRKLAESETMNKELRSVNGQLKTMLENMEGKGTKIAQLAREKVLKYKEENVKMQQQLDQMKTDAADSAANSDLLAGVEKAEVTGYLKRHYVTPHTAAGGTSVAAISRSSERLIRRS